VASEQRIQFLKEACNFHINEIIEEHMENEQCCLCCDTAFTNRGEKDPDIVPRQCYNTRCPCWDKKKACTTCRQECTNNAQKYLRKSKPTQDQPVKEPQRKKEDPSKLIADGSSPSRSPKVKVAVHVLDVVKESVPVGMTIKIAPIVVSLQKNNVVM